MDINQNQIYEAKLESPTNQSINYPMLLSGDLMEVQQNKPKDIHPIVISNLLDYIWTLTLLIQFMFFVKLWTVEVTFMKQTTEQN